MILPSSFSSYPAPAPALEVHRVTSSSYSSKTEYENVAHFQNPITTENHDQEPITEEKKGKKIVRKPLTWKTNDAKIL